MYMHTWSLVFLKSMASHICAFDAAHPFAHAHHFSIIYWCIMMYQLLISVSASFMTSKNHCQRQLPVDISWCLAEYHFLDGQWGGISLTLREIMAPQAKPESCGHCGIECEVSKHVHVSSFVIHLHHSSFALCVPTLQPFLLKYIALKMLAYITIIC